MATMRTITNSAAAMAALTILLALSACATVKPDARLPQVQDLAGSRINQNVVWLRDSESDQMARAAVRRLLQQELTADSAVQVALLNNRNLQATYTSLGIAQADLVDAGLLDNPVFSLTWYTGSAGSAPELSVVQDFVSLLSWSARRKIGAAAADRVTYEVAGGIVEVATEVQAQYYTVVGDAQALELSRQIIVATQAAAELAERQRAAGNLTQRDQAVQQAFYAQTLLDVAQAEAQLAVDREKLNRSLGLWGADTRWRIPDQLPPVPPALPALTEVEARAVEQRLDLAAARKEAETALQAVNLARQFRYLRPFGIGVAYKREPGGDKFAGPVVELGLPLFSQSQARLARAEAEAGRSEQRVTALAIDIRSQAREARARLVMAHQVLNHYRSVMLPLQQTIVSETQKYYNGMLVGVYDLLMAKQAQIQTARQYVAATRDFWLAWSDLERAIGSRLPTPAESIPSANDAPAQPDGANVSPTHEHGDQQP
jgi:cobalt-zinc-cadmium efflux system outer membrane protein